MGSLSCQLPCTAIKPAFRYTDCWERDVDCIVCRIETRREPSYVVLLSALSLQATCLCPDTARGNESGHTDRTTAVSAHSRLGNFPQKSVRKGRSLAKLGYCGSSEESSVVRGIGPQNSCGSLSSRVGAPLAFAHAVYLQGLVCCALRYGN